MVFAHEIKGKYTWVIFSPNVLDTVSLNIEALLFILPGLFPYHLIFIIIPDHKQNVLSFILRR